MERCITFGGKQCRLEIDTTLLRREERKSGGPMVSTLAWLLETMIDEEGRDTVTGVAQCKQDKGRGHAKY